MVGMMWIQRTLRVGDVESVVARKRARAAVGNRLDGAERPESPVLLEK
jgi:hypothetical protein